MPFLRCTQNLLKKLKVKPSDEPGSDSRLGDWYANVLRLSRKQCVLFVNEKTLFSFVAVQVSLKPEKVREAFLHRLNFVLVEEGFNPGKVLQVCKEYQDVQFAKTNSRSILGSMNDLARLYEIRVEIAGGLESCDISELTWNMNRTPQNNLEWCYSIDEMKRWID